MTINVPVLGVHRPRAIPLMLLLAVALALPACSASLAPSAAVMPTQELSSASPSVAPTTHSTREPTPSPAVSLSVVGWEKIGELPLQADLPTPLTGLVALDGGYLALAEPRSALLSEDGREWQATELPFDPTLNQFGVTLHARALSVASDGSRVVVVGVYDREPCREPFRVTGSADCSSSPISWASDDGSSWQRSAGWNGPPDPSGTDRGSTFTTVSSVPDGWEAWIGYRDGAAIVQLTLWRSSDGLTWDPLDGQPPLSDAYGSEHSLVGTDGTRLVAEHDFGAPDVLRLHLGRAGGWSEVSVPDVASITSGIAPGAVGQPWLLGGFNNADGGYAPGAWHSTDLATWTPTVLGELTSQGIYPIRLFRIPGGFLAIGSAYYGLEGVHHTWSSADGLEWREVLNAEFGPELVACGSVGCLGAGVAGPDAQLGVWSLVTE